MQLAIHVGNFHTTSDMEKDYVPIIPLICLVNPRKTIYMYMYHTDTSFITNMHQSIAIGIEVNIYSNTKNL